MSNRFKKNYSYLLFVLILAFLPCQTLIAAVVGNNIPIISGVPALKVIVGGAFNFTPTASDPDNDPLTFSITNKPDWMTFNAATGQLSGTPTLADVGVTSSGYVISANDNKGGTAKLAAYNIAVLASVNTPPVISGVPALKVNVGSLFSFTPVASDANNDALTFSITNQPSWMTFDATTGKLSGMPTLTDVGISPTGYVISVNDGKGGIAKLAAFNISVVSEGSVSNSPPVISGTPPPSVLVNTAYSFTPTASDPDNNPLTFNIVNKPTWATFNSVTGTLSGTPTGAGNSTGIVITVSDGKGGTASLVAFNIAITAVNRPPVISGTPVLTAKTGVNYSFLPTSSDPDNNNLTFSIDNKPAWAGFDTTTGKLSGAPALTNVGTFKDIAIKVDDGKGGTASITPFTITVTAFNIAQAFGIANQGGTLGSDTANQAIDGLDSTINHTTCDAVSNWWQVKLPAPTQISKIIVRNRTSNLTRLNGANVYVTDVPFAGIPADTFKVATLTGASGDQNVTFNTPKSGTYIIIKAANGECLHMREVGVYGQVPDAPGFQQPVYEFTTDFNAQPDTVVGATKAISYQSLPLTYQIPPGLPFYVDAQGVIKVNGAVKPMIYKFNITASDGTKTATSLVKVNATMNLARQFGNATQGGTLGAHPASLSIDGLDSTFSHSTCDAATDWWQVELPKPSQINRIVVRNYAGFASRLNGAKVYVTDTPYAGEPESTFQVALLTSTTADQTTLFATPKTGTYVIVKAANNQCLEMEEVEVYGEAPPAPKAVKSPLSYLIAHATAIGTKIDTIAAVDYQLEPITFAVQGNVPFAIDNSGSLTVSSTITPGTTYSFQVTLIDGINTSSVPVTVKISALDALPVALQRGDASSITTGELIDAAIALSQNNLDYCTTELAKIYPSGLQTALFSNNFSVYSTSSSSRNLPLHVSNISPNALVYSWMGKKENGTRFAFLGANVFSDSTNTALKSSTLNLLRWLMTRDIADNIQNEPLVIFTPTPTDKNNLNAWFTANSLQHKWTITSDTSLLTTGAFDLYFGSGDNLLSQIKTTFSLNKPVLFYTKTTVSPSLLQEFDLATVSTTSTRNIGDFASVVNQCHVALKNSKVLNNLYTGLKSGLPDFIYESTECVDSVGKISCATDQVSDATGVDASGQAIGKTVDKTVLEGITEANSVISSLDNLGVNIFSLDSTKDLYKIAVLLGDKYRETVQYPMDKVATDDNLFYQSYYADSVVHYARPNTPVQPDLGLFSENQFILNAQPTKTKTITLTPTAYSEWTSTGVYLPPGKTITIRRTDTSTAKVKLRCNFTRQTTRKWNDFGYNRPLYLSSNDMSLDIGKTYTFSTPYGGPAYLNWDAVATGAVPFTVEFGNVLDNPLISTFDESSIQSYLTALNTSDSEWVDLKTPFAEIHSKKSYMFKAFAKQDGSESNGFTTQDVQDYVSDLNSYLILGNYALAGFKDSELPPLKPEVKAFCDRQGLSSVLYNGTTVNLCEDSRIHRKPKVQHINAEIDAACGSLCSGNPFDSGGPINPVGWGENHEMGHNLQVGRLKIYSGRTGEVSNNIYPVYTMTKWAGIHGLTQSKSDNDRPHNLEAFNMLQSAIKAGTAPSTNYPLWAGTGIYDNAFERLAFYVQVAYISQTWDVYTKLMLMDRIYGDALGSDVKWNAVKNLLGFGNYGRTNTNGSTPSANNITGNDFMYIALSMIEQRNYSDCFKAWGIDITQAAKDQVTANGITEQVPVRFYYVTPKVMPVVMPTFAESIPLDGVSTYVDPLP